MSWLDEIRAALGSAQQPLRSVNDAIADPRGTLGAMQSPLRSTAEVAVQNGLQPTLQAAGGAGNFARGAGMTIGNLIRGRTDEAQDAARRAFTGIANSGDRISAQEALRLPPRKSRNTY